MAAGVAWLQISRWNHQVASWEIRVGVVGGLNRGTLQCTMTPWIFGSTKFQTSDCLLGLLFQRARMLPECNQSEFPNMAWWKQTTQEWLATHECHCEGHKLCFGDLVRALYGRITQTDCEQRGTAITNTINMKNIGFLEWVGQRQNHSIGQKVTFNILRTSLTLWIWGSQQLPNATSGMPASLNNTGHIVIWNEATSNIFKPVHMWWSLLQPSSFWPGKGGPSLQSMLTNLSCTLSEQVREVHGPNRYMLLFYSRFSSQLSGFLGDHRENLL